MNKSCNFSNVTNDYLAAYECILRDMMDGMTHADLSDSISHNFITQMIPHHQGAIEMSRNILRYTTNIPLQNLALQIIPEQTKSISCMRSILRKCEAVHNCKQDLYRYQTRTRQIMQTMFCDEMRLHHQLRQRQFCPSDDSPPLCRHRHVREHPALLYLSGADPDSGLYYPFSADGGTKDAVHASVHGVIRVIILD